MTREEVDRLLEETFERDGGCVISGINHTCSRKHDPHHVIKQQTLGRFLHGEELHRALRDRRGAVTVCRTGHGAVHAGVVRIPPTVLMQTEFYIPGDVVTEPTFTGDYDLRAVWEGIVAKQLPTHRRLEV